MSGLPADSRLVVIGAGGPFAVALLDRLADLQIPRSQLVLLDDDAAPPTAPDYLGHRLTPLRCEDFSFLPQDRVVVDPAFDPSHASIAAALDAGAEVFVAGREPESPEQRLQMIPHVLAIALSRLGPFFEAVHPRAMHATAMLAVSDAGGDGPEELAQQTRQLLGFTSATPTRFPAQIAFNVVPAEPEAAQRAVEACRAIPELRSASLDIDLFWVPVFYGHGVQFQFESATPLSLQALRTALWNCKGVALAGAGETVTAVGNASGSDDLSIGNLALGGDAGQSVRLWMVFDNMRVLAAYLTGALGLGG